MGLCARLPLALSSPYARSFETFFNIAFKAFLKALLSFNVICRIGLFNKYTIL